MALLSRFVSGNKAAKPRRQDMEDLEARLLSSEASGLIVEASDNAVLASKDDIYDADGIPTGNLSPEMLELFNLSAEKHFEGNRKLAWENFACHASEIRDTLRSAELKGISYIGHLGCRLGLKGAKAVGKSTGIAVTVAACAVFYSEILPLFSYNQTEKLWDWIDDYPRSEKWANKGYLISGITEALVGLAGIGFSVYNFLAYDDIPSKDNLFFLYPLIEGVYRTGVASSPFARDFERIPSLPFYLLGKTCQGLSFVGKGVYKGITYFCKSISEGLNNESNKLRTELKDKAYERILEEIKPPEESSGL